MFEKIPFELRQLNQWVLWRYVTVDPAKAPTKVPFHPHGHKADTMNHETWSSFVDVVAALQAGGFNGIGFVFSRFDPYFGCDIDKVMRQLAAVQAGQQRVFEAFNTYSEWSPSGEGIHIIGKGSVPSGRNNRERAIEIYSEGRFFTFTGNAIRDVSIADCHDLANNLWEELGGTVKPLPTVASQPQTAEDVDIYNRAHTAANGAVFDRLWAGDYSAYPSQSEADMALINILQFYSKSADQIARMFLLSGLGQRDKAKRGDYLRRCIARAFDRELPTIDFSGLDRTVGTQVAIVDQPPEILTRGPYTLPPGLLGEVANFIFTAVPRPIPEAALAAAIVMLAGICGKAFNVSGTGLNQYILFMAQTSVGKEGMSRGVNKLLQRLSLNVPTADEFRGSSNIASGQALSKMIAESKTGGSMFVLAGEFGQRLEMMSGPNAAPSDRMLLTQLLELYNKSGKDDVFQGTVYSDSAKNMKSVRGPAFSLLGEGVPQSFYTSIDERTILSGLMPRFTIIEYNGNRPSLNYGFDTVEPPEALMAKLSEFTGLCMARLAHNTIESVSYSEEVKAADRALEVVCTNTINGTSRLVVRALWGRVHIKVLKLAALLAVTTNHVAPMITINEFEWARKIIIFETEMMVAKLDSGNLVSDANNLEYEQTVAIARIIQRFVNGPYGHSFRSNLEMKKNKILFMSDIVSRCTGLAVFKRDYRKDNSQKINRAIESLKAADIIIEFNMAGMSSAKGGRAVQVVSDQFLDEFINNG